MNIDPIAKVFKEDAETSRWVKRFAYLPTLLGRGYVQYHTGPYIWLGYFYELQHYIHGKWTPYCGGVIWVQEPWDLSSRPKNKRHLQIVR